MDNNERTVACRYPGSARYLSGRVECERCVQAGGARALYVAQISALSGQAVPSIFSRELATCLSTPTVSPRRKNAR